MPSRRPTILDVAARAGVSKSLASRALRGEGRVSGASEAAIQAAAEELGYRPNLIARQMVQARTKTIGLLVINVHNPVTGELLDVVQAELLKRGWHTMIVTDHPEPGQEAAEVAKLVDFRVEGLLVIGHRPPEGIARSRPPAYPIVVAGARFRGIPNVGSVGNDDEAGAHLAVDHLVSLGHRHIAHINGGDNGPARERERGYLRAMAAHRLTGKTQIITGGFGDDSGYAAALTLLQNSQRPSAIFVANDYAAVGTLAAAMDIGVQVPEDLSVIGYDGIAIGALRPFNLTTIAQPRVDIGRRAVECLLARIEHPRQRPTHIQLPPRLVIRGSTARMRKR